VPAWRLPCAGLDVTPPHRPPAAVSRPAAAVRPNRTPAGFRRARSASPTGDRARSAASPPHRNSGHGETAPGRLWLATPSGRPPWPRSPAAAGVELRPKRRGRSRRRAQPGCVPPRRWHRRRGGLRSRRGRRRIPAPMCGLRRPRIAVGVEPVADRERIVVAGFEHGEATVMATQRHHLAGGGNQHIGLHRRQRGDAGRGCEPRARPAERTALFERPSY
jgi:hypothetical protein